MTLTSGQMGTHNIESIDLRNAKSTAALLVKHYIGSQAATVEAALAVETPSAQDYLRLINRKGTRHYPSFMRMKSDFGGGEPISDQEALNRAFAAARDLLRRIKAEIADGRKTGSRSAAQLFSSAVDRLK